MPGKRFPVFFWLSLLAMAGTLLWGLIQPEALLQASRQVFYRALRDFAGLYQGLMLATLALLLWAWFSPWGRKRFGGDTARAHFSLPTAFAISLAGGMATGAITYAVNEPIIYYGSIYGELSQQNFPPASPEAATFALARSFYHWSFMPYGVYAAVALLFAALHHQQHRALSLQSALDWSLGRWARLPGLSAFLTTTAVLALALGLAAMMGMGLSLLGVGLHMRFQWDMDLPRWLSLSALMLALFLISSLSGLRRGIRLLSQLNVYLFYGLMLLLLFLADAGDLAQRSGQALAHWGRHFLAWSLDTGAEGGEALVTWWTLYDWAVWIAYAPLMGLFLARLAYGRTVREFLLLNWLWPSCFALLWFTLWGGSALQWQESGALDLVGTIRSQGAVSGLWLFLQHLPGADFWVPLVMLTLMLSFVTAADSMVSTLASLSSPTPDEEAPAPLKIIWGVAIAALALLMVAFGRGSQGVDGLKFLGAAAGAVVTLLFMVLLVGLARLLWNSARGSASG